MSKIHDSGESQKINKKANTGFKGNEVKPEVQKAEEPVKQVNGESLRRDPAVIRNQYAVKKYQAPETPSFNGIPLDPKMIEQVAADLVILKNPDKAAKVAFGEKLSDLVYDQEMKNGHPHAGTVAALAHTQFVDENIKA